MQPYFDPTRKNGRRPQKNKKMEEDLKKMEENLKKNGRRPQKKWKITSISFVRIVIDIINKPRKK